MALALPAKPPGACTKMREGKRRKKMIEEKIARQLLIIHGQEWEYRMNSARLSRHTSFGNNSTYSQAIRILMFKKKEMLPAYFETYSKLAVTSKPFLSCDEILSVYSRLCLNTRMCRMLIESFDL